MYSTLWRLMAGMLVVLHGAPQQYTGRDRLTRADTFVDPSPHRSGVVAVNGVRLHYLDWGGTGKPLVFLHGLGHSAHIFDDLAPKFVNEFRVLALTWRGHGKSDKPKTGYDVDTLTEDLRQFLDAMNVDRVTLAGHSMAGEELTRFCELVFGTRPGAGLSGRRLRSDGSVLQKFLQILEEQGPRRFCLTQPFERGSHVDRSNARLFPEDEGRLVQRHRSGLA